MTQAFLHAGQHALIITGVHIDDAVGGQPGLLQPGCEKIGLRYAPQHWAVEAGGDAGGKARGRRPVHGTTPAARDFMQTAEDEAALWQATIEFGYIEWQHRGWRAAVTLDRRDLLAQRGKGRVRGASGHGSVSLR